MAARAEAAAACDAGRGTLLTSSPLVASIPPSWLCFRTLQGPCLGLPALLHDGKACLLACWGWLRGAGMLSRTGEGFAEQKPYL